MPDRVIYVEAGDEKSVLICFEEGLRHGGLGAVVAEVARLSMTASRRLQLAAEGSGTIGIAIRRWRRPAEAADFGQPTASVTRWRVSALPSTPLPVPGVGRARWQVELFEGSSVQGWKEGRVEVAILMAIPVSCCLLRYAIAELLHGRDKAPLGDRFGVVEDSCLTAVIGDLGRLHTRLPLDDGFDGLGAAVASACHRSSGARFPSDVPLLTFDGNGVATVFPRWAVWSSASSTHPESKRLAARLGRGMLQSRSQGRRPPLEAAQSSG
jgi:hypothetical protein